MKNVQLEWLCRVNVYFFVKLTLTISKFRVFGVKDKLPSPPAPNISMV